MATIRAPFLIASPRDVVPVDKSWSNGQNLQTTSVGAITADGLLSEFIRRQSAQSLALRREYPGIIGGIHHLLDPNTPLKRKLIWQSYMKIEHPATAGAEFIVGFASGLIGGIHLGVGFACQSDAQSWKARIADSSDDINANVVFNGDTGISSGVMRFLKFTIDGALAKMTWEIDGQVVAAHTMTSPLDKLGTFGVPLRYMVTTVANENHGLIFHSGGGVILYMEYESP